MLDDITFTDFFHIDFLYHNQVFINNFIMCFKWEKLGCYYCTQSCICIQLVWQYSTALHLYPCITINLCSILEADYWNYTKLNFYFHVFMKSWELHSLYRCRRMEGMEHTTPCFNKSCPPKGRANDSGQTWVTRLVFILNQL